MNSILKLTAKILEELNQLSGMNDAKQGEMQHTKGRLREVLKKKWKKSNGRAVHKEYG
jgi:hypothetical protein